MFSARYGVSATEQLAPDVTHIQMVPTDAAITPRCSQFAFFRRGLRGSARPFTISGFDSETGEVAITVKAVGRVSTDLQGVRPGEPMYVDGPYGVFGIDALEGDRPIVMILTTLVKRGSSPPS